jgi:hypothetical protein
MKIRVLQFLFLRCFPRHAESQPPPNFGSSVRGWSPFSFCNHIVVSLIAATSSSALVSVSHQHEAAFGSRSIFLRPDSACRSISCLPHQIPLPGFDFPSIWFLPAEPLRQHQCVLLSPTRLTPSRISDASGAKPVLLVFSSGQIHFTLCCFCCCKLTTTIGACSAWFDCCHRLSTTLFRSSSSWFGLPPGADGPPPSSDFCRLQAKARCLVSFPHWSSVQ